MSKTQCRRGLTVLWGRIRTATRKYKIQRQATACGTGADTGNKNVKRTGGTEWERKEVKRFTDNVISCT